MQCLLIVGFFFLWLVLSVTLFDFLFISLHALNFFGQFIFFGMISENIPETMALLIGLQNFIYYHAGISIVDFEQVNDGWDI